MEEVSSPEQQPLIRIYIAGKQHIHYVEEILDVIEESSKARGTGIARRSPEYVAQKMLEGKAIIALCGDDFAGFCYIESWSNKEYVVNSGLIVKPKYRGFGLAKRIKMFSFAYSRRLFPKAKLFGLTSGAAVLKINSILAQFFTFDYAQLAKTTGPGTGGICCFYCWCDRRRRSGDMERGRGGCHFLS